MDASGNYNDHSETSGLFYPADAMSASWCDLDHDCDLDLFCSNSSSDSYLMMRNNGMGYFTQDSLSDLSYNLEGWGSLFIDAENDGWEDLFICTKMGEESPEGNNIYLKNLNGVLINCEINTITNLPLGFHSNAKGDYNNDGKYDIIASPAIVENLHLFRNNSLGNSHYLKFKLNGRLSNRNGFGVHYTCHSGDFISYGYTQCGENYLSQNSQNIILGLNEHTLVDSLILAWPSGIVDKYFNIAVDQFIQLTEAETIEGISIAYDSCGISLPTASVNPVFTDIIWSTGLLNSNSIPANTDSITAIVSTGFGNPILFSALNINTEIATFTWETIPPICNTSLGTAQLHWTMDDTLFTLDSTFHIAHGFNYISHTTPGGCIANDTLNVEAGYSINVLQTQATPICQYEDLGSIEIITATENNMGTIDTITHVISGLAQGWNSGIVTDNHNCSIDWSSYLPQSSWNISTQQPLCAEDSTGKIFIEYVTDDNDAITFSDSLSQLTSGYYQQYYESMPDGCPFQWEVMLNPLESIDWEISYPNQLCQGDSFLLNAEVLTSSEIILWEGPENNSWLDAGSYTLTIETINGCNSQQAFIVENYDTIETEEFIEYEDSFAEIEISLAGNFEWFDCLWQNGMIGNEIQVNVPGSYSYTITDEHGCVYSDSVWVENWLTNVPEIQDFFLLVRAN